jgi:hypothetical protein
MTNTEDLTVFKDFERMKATFQTSPAHISTIPNFHGREAKVYGFSSILNSVHTVAPFYKLVYKAKIMKNCRMLKVVEYMDMDAIIHYHMIFYDALFETVCNFNRQSMYVTGCDYLSPDALPLLATAI